MKNGFEQQINRLIDTINDLDKNALAFKNHAYRTHMGTYIDGEMFDYIIMTPGYKCLFDAKETHTRVWHIYSKDFKQANYLKKGKKLAFDAYFLIYFYSLKEYRKLDIIQFYKITTTGRRSVRFEETEPFDLSKKVKEGIENE
jgi:penicillin-binding protein-related factor A (putative recombinase)